MIDDRTAVELLKANKAVWGGAIKSSVDKATGQHVATYTIDGDVTTGKGPTKEAAIISLAHAVNG